MECYLTVDRYFIDEAIEHALIVELQNEIFDSWRDTPVECYPQNIRSTLDELVSAKIIQCLNDNSGQESHLFPIKRHIGYFLLRYNIQPRYVKKVIIHDTGIDLVLE